MHINLGQSQQAAAAQSAAPSRGKVTVSMNPVRQSTFIDADGNEYDSINPRTRKLIRRADQA
jgi:hypothetical protein